MHTAFQGFAMGLSLIIAIGAQNIFVLRQGLRGEHIALVVVLCALSDAVLIILGVGGLTVVVSSVPGLVDVARWGGALFLLAYAVLAARRALRPAPTQAVPVGADGSEVEPADHPTAAHLGTTVPAGTDMPAETTAPIGTAGTADRGHGRGALAVAGTTLALTWLNPHVYLDTVLMLGSVAATHGDGRWLFAGGAVAGSILWFSALGFGARALAPVLRRPGAWRILDGVVALLMILCAVLLIAGTGS